jgi:hypothetical protein
MHPATWEALRCIGATEQHQDAAMRAIIDTATDPRQKPGGPLMQQAVDAARKWQARQPQQDNEADEPEPIDLSDETAEYEFDGMVREPGPFYIDLSVHDEPEPVEPEPVELEPDERPMVEPPVAPKRPVVFNM